MTVTLTDEDEGKTVVDASGTALGLVTKVQGNTAFVEPDPGVTEKVKAALGWGDADSEEYTVEHDAIESKTDDELHLRGNL
jgi:hypothetical protein